MAGTSSDFRNQWSEPSDIFSVLLILGGDVIKMALAALSGTYLTPVAFSFGWVAYAISALLSAVAENRLMPSNPEIAITTINLRTRYARPNHSWLLSRVFKDYEFWMPEEVKLALQPQSRTRDEEEGCIKQEPEDTTNGPNCQQGKSRSSRVALCVAVYKWAIPTSTTQGGSHRPGVPARDWVWWSGFLVTALQLGIGAIPFGLYQYWAIFLITACGTLLAYASGALPQWGHEKWACRRQKRDVAITQGNGTLHVIAVVGDDQGLDLEDLASGQVQGLPSTRIFSFILAVLWLLLLITSAGTGSHTWYLLAVGNIGMVHNLIVAGAPRHPAALGIPLTLIKKVEKQPGERKHRPLREVPMIFAEEKVMWTLMALEERYPNFGGSLLREFFPGELRPWEKEWWETSDVKRRRCLLADAKLEYYMKKELLEVQKNT